MLFTEAVKYVKQISVQRRNGRADINDVKDYVKGEERSVTLYAAFLAPIPRDLVVAWYRAEGVSTASGLTEEIMTNFEAALKDYLTTQGYDLEKVTITIRSYEGKVAAMGEAVNTDGDVDILIGVGKNITSQGGVTTVVKDEGIPMGGIEGGRYIARLTQTEIAELVYNWIKEAGYSSLAPIA